jgi:hypothetical protein
VNSFLYTEHNIDSIPPSSLLITLSILKQLATDCKRDLTLFSTAVMASVKASLVALPDDLEVAARAASVVSLISP